MQSPVKVNQNKVTPSSLSTKNINNNELEEEEEDISNEFFKISVSSATNSDAPTNSIDFAEVNKEKTLSRDPPKRTHVSSSNKDLDDF